MKDVQTKDARLKSFLKEQVKSSLLSVGRRLVTEKGADFLTARKLSDASKISIGTIYNLFATMDHFIMAENMQTLDELYQEMTVIIPAENPYLTINRYTDVFSAFVINHPELWQLLFREHLNYRGQKWPLGYLKKMRRIEALFERQIGLMFGKINTAERRLAGQVLEMSLFALSGFVSGYAWDNLRQVNKQNVCKLLLNTYLAGLASLKKVTKC